MRKLGGFIAVAAAVGLTVPGHAAGLDGAGMHFTPKNAAIEGKGSMTLTARRSVSCAIGLDISTVNTYANITAVSFTGHQCGSIQPGGLPWRVSIEEGGFGGFHPLTIHGFALQFVHGATCGPADIKAKLNPHGLIKFSRAAFRGTTPCTVDGSVSTDPNLGVKASAQ